MRKIFLMLLFVGICSVAYAASLNPSDAAMIESAGVPIYSGATFVYGNSSVGFRFASAVPPDEIRQWYREKLPKWSVQDKYGSWIMYDGEPGAGPGEVMFKKQVLIMKNENLPSWYSLDKNMTTEVTIMNVKSK